jgi:hypothetical protein
VPVVPIHDDEIRATVGQMRRLVVAQCPQWADLPVTPQPEELEGTDHVLFRIGDEILARMPKIAWASCAAPNRPGRRPDQATRFAGVRPAPRR